MNELVGYNTDIFVVEHGTGWIQCRDFRGRTRKVSVTNNVVKN
jgi:hypothetical protein